jgi:cysteine-S-conjugate beta-lyase
MTDADLPDWNLTDDELRAAGSVKWTWEGADVLPAWVAEMDVRPCPAVLSAVQDGVQRAAFGYPPRDQDSGVPEATAAFVARRFGWQVDPAFVITTGDVMAAVRLALEALCEAAPVVVPVPSYPPFLDVVPLTGRQLVTVPSRRDDDGTARLDLTAVEAALAAGARTVLLSQPHNPLGRVFDVAELGALRDVVVRHGARVISDEIHAPLVLPADAPVQHVPYASLPGSADHTTTVVAASKAFNLAGLKCAQLVAGDAGDLALLQALPHVANHGVASLGLVATKAAYEHGDPWLDGVVAHLGQRRDQFAALLAEHLPQLTWTPLQATYLAWLDASPTGIADPAAAALAQGRVFVMGGRGFDPTGDHDRYVRVNLATSAQRLERIVAGLARAWSP